jgi:hypothetical protein
MIKIIAEKIYYMDATPRWNAYHTNDFDIIC